MSRQNVETVRRGLEAWNIALADADEATRRSALLGVAATFHPDAELDFSRTTPDYAPTRGTHAMIAWTEAARETLVGIQVEPTRFIDTDDAVVVVLRFAGEGVSSGAQTAMEVNWAVRFTAGKVSSATSFPTLPEALKAVGVEE